VSSSASESRPAASNRARTLRRVVPHGLRSF
jgi:hypothetical protein